jgi:type II secretory pathway pseudopilin PulG
MIRKIKLKENKKAQIWIETVLYTLIGISLIGVVLAFVTPKITEQKEKLMVEQTIQALNAFDEKINTVLQAPSNVREINFAMKQGEFHINSTEDRVMFVLPGLTKPYSEPGVPIDVGRIKLLTSEHGGDYDVVLSVSYRENVTYVLEDTNKKLDAVAVPYRFSISNEGVLNSDGRNVISIRELSGS